MFKHLWSEYIKLSQWDIRVNRSHAATKASQSGTVPQQSCGETSYGSELKTISPGQLEDWDLCRRRILLRSLGREEWRRKGAFLTVINAATSLVHYMVVTLRFGFQTCAYTRSGVCAHSINAGWGSRWDWSRCCIIYCIIILSQPWSYQRRAGVSLLRWYKSLTHQEWGFLSQALWSALLEVFHSQRMQQVIGPPSHLLLPSPAGLRGTLLGSVFLFTWCCLLTNRDPLNFWR